MVVREIPVSSTTLTPFVEIDSEFVDELGMYRFDSVPVNLMPLDSSAVYILEQLTVSANINQADYFQGVVDPILMTIGLEQTGVRCQYFPDDFPVVVIEYPVPLTSTFYTLDTNDSLTIAVSGSISQLSSMVDLSKIKLRISAVVHRCKSQNFVDMVKREWGQ